MTSGMTPTSDPVMTRLRRSGITGSWTAPRSTTRKKLDHTSRSVTAPSPRRARAPVHGQRDPPLRSVGIRSRTQARQQPRFLRDLAILAEAYALTRRAGADADVLVRVMPHNSADSWQLRHTLIDKVLKDDLSPMFKVGLAAKDMRLLKELAGRLAARFDCRQGVLNLYDAAEHHGMADMDWGAIVLLDQSNW